MRTLIFSLRFNGYIENVSGALFFRSVFNGYIDNVTETLFFKFSF